MLKDKVLLMIIWRKAFSMQCLHFHQQNFDVLHVCELKENISSSSHKYGL